MPRSASSGDSATHSCASNARATSPCAQEVDALLAAHETAGSFIEAPIVTLDARLFEDDEADRLIGQTIGH